MSIIEKVGILDWNTLRSASASLELIDAVGIEKRCRFDRRNKRTHREARPPFARSLLIRRLRFGQ